MKPISKVLLVGGPDIDARLDLMHSISDRFEIIALGSLSSLHDKFSTEGFCYYSYTLNRGVNILGDLKTIFQLINIFRELKPQIVHTFDSKPCVLGRMAAHWAGIPIIIGTLPGLGSLYSNDSLATQFLRFFYQELQRLACRVSDLTMFQNFDDFRQFIKARIVLEQKAKVILGSGINTNLFSPDNISDDTKDKLKTEFKIQPDEIVVTMISRIIYSKGVIEFMKSAQEMHLNNPKLHFLLIGSEDRESIDRLSQEDIVQLKRVVDWRGSRSDISSILAISDIFVLPSIYREGIPRVLLEAAAMELPIVTTNSPGCKEVVENGINGFLIPMHNSKALSSAIKSLIEKPELRCVFGQVSRQKAIQKFDTKKISDQIKALYEQLLVNYMKE
jgi:glycosyltransferase involved in cell wall biosynthesis